MSGRESVGMSVWMLVARLAVALGFVALGVFDLLKGCHGC